MAERALDRFAQPIRAPGARLLGAPKLRFVSRCRARRSGGFELPLVPLVDCLLALVLFLLSSFNVSAECCIEQRVDEPRAENTMPILEAPVVAVTTTRVLVDGVPAGSTRDIAEAAGVQRIAALFDVLKNKRELWKQINPGRPFPGMALLRIDRSVPSLVVKSVFQSTAIAGFPHIAFMVKRAGQGAPRREASLSVRTSHPR